MNYMGGEGSSFSLEGDNEVKALAYYGVEEAVECAVGGTDIYIYIYELMEFLSLFLHGP